MRRMGVADTLEGITRPVDRVGFYTFSDWRRSDDDLVTDPGLLVPSTPMTAGTQHVGSLQPVESPGRMGKVGRSSGPKQDAGS
jgi:hypothetical protein